MREQTHPGAARPLSRWFDPSPANGTPTTPAVAVGLGIPSSTEEGTLLQRSLK